MHFLCTMTKKERSSAQRKAGARLSAAHFFIIHQSRKRSRWDTGKKTKYKMRQALNLCLAHIFVNFVKFCLQNCRQTMRASSKRLRLVIKHRTFLFNNRRNFRRRCNRCFCRFGCGYSCRRGRRRLRFRRFSCFLSRGR